MPYHRFLLMELLVNVFFTKGPAFLVTANFYIIGFFTGWLYFSMSFDWLDVIWHVTGAKRNLAPCALTSKSNQWQGREATLLKVLHSCLMSRSWWVDRCLKFKTSTSKPCHIVCQLGSALDNVDGVKAVFENQILGLTKVMRGGDIRHLGVKWDF